MKYQKGLENGDAIYRFSGHWTFKDHEKAVTISKEIGQHRNEKFILDLSDVDYIDSSGLGMLLMMRDRTERTRNEMTIHGAAQEVRHLMKLAKFDTVFTVSE